MIPNAELKEVCERHRENAENASMLMEDVADDQALECCGLIHCHAKLAKAHLDSLAALLEDKTAHLPDV